MNIEDLFKDNEEVLKAIKDSGAKFIDLKDGQYVDKNKYENIKLKHDKLETQLQELQNAPNPLEGEIEKVRQEDKEKLDREIEKISVIIKNKEIDSAVASLGLTDKIAVAGVRSLIDNSKLTLDEQYNVSGLDEQIADIKKTYAESFISPSHVSTGPTVNNSSSAGSVKKYTSAEIDNMSLEEVIQNLDAVNASLGSK